MRSTLLGSGETRGQRHLIYRYTCVDDSAQSPNINMHWAIGSTESIFRFGVYMIATDDNSIEITHQV